MNQADVNSIAGELFFFTYHFTLLPNLACAGTAFAFRSDTICLISDDLQEQYCEQAEGEWVSVFIGQDSPVNHIFRILRFMVFGNLDGDLISPYPSSVKIIRNSANRQRVAVSNLIRYPIFVMTKIWEIKNNVQTKTEIFLRCTTWSCAPKSPF